MLPFLHYSSPSCVFISCFMSLFRLVIAGVVTWNSFCDSFTSLLMQFLLMHELTSIWLTTQEEVSRLFGVLFFLLSIEYHKLYLLWPPTFSQCHRSALGEDCIHFMFPSLNCSLRSLDWEVEAFTSLIFFITSWIFYCLMFSVLKTNISYILSIFFYRGKQVWPHSFLLASI